MHQPHFKGISTEYSASVGNCFSNTCDTHIDKDEGMVLVTFFTDIIIATQRIDRRTTVNKFTKVFELLLDSNMFVESDMCILN